MSKNLDMLYQELDQALIELRAKEKKLSSNMRDVDIWFKAARGTCKKIEGYHEQGLQPSKKRIDKFKETKTEMQTFRDELKALFDQLFGQGWSQDLA